MKHFVFAIALLGVLIIKNASAQTPSVIFDSDMGPDYDDVGAIAMLHALADSGQVKILATVASTRFEGVAAVFDVFNTYFKRQNLPIGVPKGPAVEQKDWQHWTDTVLRRYPHRIKKNAEARDAIDVYREALSKAPDKSVTIITVGFLTNLANLLRSKPDKHSTLGGKELVERKVKHLVSMAGWFPKGKEFNVVADCIHGMANTNSVEWRRSGNENQDRVAACEKYVDQEQSGERCFRYVYPYGQTRY
jgi:inosine-uridine nucleoside N-ribohydrolase